MYGDNLKFKPGELIELAPGVLTSPWKPWTRLLCLYLRPEIASPEYSDGKSIINHVVLIRGKEVLCDINVFNRAKAL